jgi:hypothetical protein
LKKTEKKARLRITELDKDDYDVIYSEGYEECLRDIYKSLGEIIHNIEEHDYDPIEYLTKFREKVKKTLNVQNDSLN